METHEPSTPKSGGQDPEPPGLMPMIG